MPTTNSLAESWTTEPLGRVAAPIREQVISSLRQAILDFQLRPGQRLIERELIDQLRVSRTTIREALRELTSEGLVTVIPQHGTVVATVRVEDAVDLYEVRVVLESRVVQRFVERATDREVAELRAAVEEVARISSEPGDMRDILASRDVYYAVLLAGAKSGPLQQLLDSVRARVQTLRPAPLVEDGRVVEVAQQLRAVAEAVEARDAALAARLSAKHVRAASVLAVRAFDNQNLDDGEVPLSAAM